MQQYVQTGAGSGVIISEDGYIVTNNHVIDGAEKITVTTKDGTAYEAKLVGTDSETDVALLKVEATGLKAVVMGNSSDLQVGDTAVVIGNPLGQLGGTVTSGIVSAGSGYYLKRQQHVSAADQRGHQSRQLRRRYV